MANGKKTDKAVVETTDENVDEITENNNSNDFVTITLRYRNSHSVGPLIFFKDKPQKVKIELYEKHKKSFEEKNYMNGNYVSYFEIKK